MADETIPTNGNGTVRIRNTLIIGLMWVLGLDLVAVAFLGAATQIWVTQDYNLVAKVIEGQLTLATVLAAGLLGMAKGTAS